MRAKHNILADVKALAAEYYELTGKPFGVTGEIAEYEAAEKLGLELSPARTQGYDAIRPATGDRIQIKGRALPKRPKAGQRVGSINVAHEFDCVVLVLMDRALAPTEMWEASREAVINRLRAPGSKSRNERGSMSVSQFKAIAKKVWPG